MPDVFQGDTEVGGNLGDVYTVREDLFAGTSVDGNGGTDTLDADGAWVIADAVSLLDLEVLALDTDQLTLSTTDFASFEDITGSGAASEGLVALTPGGVTSATVEVLGLDELEVQGSGVGDRLFFITPLGSPPAQIRVFGNEGDDIIDTGAGDDRLHGNVNDDTLDGNGGADRLFGEQQNDTLIVRSEGVEFNGGNGNDTLVLERAVHRREPDRWNVADRRARHGHAQGRYGRHLLVHREHRHHPGHREAGARSRLDLDGGVAAPDASRPSSRTGCRPPASCCWERAAPRPRTSPS